MESLKNAASSVANTASGYIYGNPDQQTSGTEPVSGEHGKGTASEPYDGGNKESVANTTSTDSTNAESTGVESKPAESTGSKGADFGSSKDPSTGAEPSSGAQPQAEHQGADGSTSGPKGEEVDAIKDKKDEGEEALKKRDPNDHSGEPMHMHTGEEKKEETLEDKDHPGQEGGDKHGESEGTGEKWIKTSGLQADGGDFDAAQAGAGKEAERLLEEKGIHKDERGAMVDSEDKPVTDIPGADHTEGGSKSKVSLGTKIKEKLHIGKK